MTAKKVLVMNLNQGAEYQQLLDGKPSIGEHSTRAHEEILVFLAGKGHALIGPNEIPYEIGTGKVIYIPPHTLHNMKNTGTETLEYVFCVAPITEIKENEHE